MDESQSKLLSKTIIFTDGACSGNPGPGGWASIIVHKNAEIKELGGREEATTNNRMEMMAAVRALDYLQDISGEIDFYTDSVYVIRGITQWIWGWRKNAWKTSDGKEVSNKDLWERLSALVQKRGPQGKIDWKYSRGHVGIPGNERCDEIAVAFSKAQFIPLYSGSILKYHVPIMDLPENTDLPEYKPKTEKTIAVGYLSNLGGIVFMHKDWSSCERRVKGQSGAKFKKVRSLDEVSDVLKSWGLSESHEVKKG